MKNWVGEYINHVHALVSCYSENFSYELISIFKLVFLANNLLDFFVRVLNLDPSTWVQILFLKIFAFFSCGGVLMNQRCQKVLLVLICFGIQNHILSVLMVSFFIGVSIKNPLLEAEFSLFFNLWNLFNISILVSWLTRRGKIANSVETSRYSNSSFSETTDLNSCIKISIEGDVAFIIVSWIQQSLILSLRLECWLDEHAKYWDQYSYFVEFQTHNTLKLSAWIPPKSLHQDDFCQN